MNFPPTSKHSRAYPASQIEYCRVVTGTVYSIRRVLSSIVRLSGSDPPHLLGEAGKQGARADALDSLSGDGLLLDRHGEVEAQLELSGSIARFQIGHSLWPTCGPVR